MQMFCRMDLQENKESNTVTATFELPGLKSEDVTIDIQQNRLTVSGELSSTSSQEAAGYAIRERHYGKFSRTLQLPVGTKVGSLASSPNSILIDVS